MSRFGRKETFISSHYAHGYPSSPVGFHPVQPLNWGPFVPYGLGAPQTQEAYGWTLATLVGARYTRSKLHSRRANVSTYDHYDAGYALQAAGLKKSVGRNTSAQALPYWSVFADVVASNDAAALLKTGYYLIAAGIALGNTGLTQAGVNRLESGYQAGIVEGAANQSSRIESTYNSALAQVQSAARGNTGETITEIIRQLKLGATKEVVQQRIQEAKSQEVVRKTAIEEKKKEEEKEKNKPCEDTWKGYIPGYCASAFAFKVVGYVFVAGVALWGVRKVAGSVMKTAAVFKKPEAAPAENPYVRSLTLRTNPSSAADMGSDPELRIALTSKGRAQERSLANTAFKHRRSK